LSFRTKNPKCLMHMHMLENPILRIVGLGCAHISPVYLRTRTFPMESIPCLTFLFLFLSVLLHFCPIVSSVFGVLSRILPQVPVEFPLCHGAFHQSSAIQTFLGNGVTSRKFFQESKHCASRAAFLTATFIDVSVP
jgi:hypothetical protein